MDKNKEELKLMKDWKADEKEVYKLMNYMLKKYNKYVNEKTKGSLSFIDALMGIHNFYKVVILDLERRTGETGMIKNIALATMKNYLSPEPLKEEIEPNKDENNDKARKENPVKKRSNSKVDKQ